MKNIILLLLISTSFTKDIFAYPISPRPLRLLVVESQFIIVGYVVKTYDNKKSNDDWTSKTAKIAVLESLQGKIDRDTVEIEFNPNMICPSPDMYFDSTFVISFIDKNKNGHFYTHALNYGAKTLTKEEIEIYKKRIVEVQQILTITDQDKQVKETVEWLVKCAENEITRWDGTFELKHSFNFLMYNSQPKNQTLGNSINVEQKERLKKALLNSSNKVDFVLVDLVYKSNENQIDDFLLEKLKELKEHNLWIADNFMSRLKHRDKRNKSKKLIKQFYKFYLEDKNEKLSKIVEDFIGLVDKK